MTGLVVVLAMIWVGGLFSLLHGCLIYRERRHIQQLTRTERIRGEFAKVRVALLREVNSGALDSRSLSFHTYYFLTTAVMRRDDRHPELSRSFWETAKWASRNHDSKSSVLVREIESWSPGMKDVARMFSEAVSCLILDYSWTLRQLASLERRFHLSERLKTVVLEKEEQRHEEIRTLKEIKDFSGQIAMGDHLVAA